MHVKGRNQLPRENRGFSCDWYRTNQYPPNPETRSEAQVACCKLFRPRAPTSAALMQRQLAEHTGISLIRHLKASGGNHKLPLCISQHKPVFRKSSMRQTRRLYSTECVKISGRVDKQLKSQVIHCTCNEISLRILSFSRPPPIWH